MRTVEAFMSILLLFSAFAVATLMYRASTPSRDEELSTIGFQALTSLDRDGQLGRQIDDRNWSILVECLNILIPLGVSFNLSIYSERLSPVNNVKLSNGALSEGKVVAVQYLCASPGLNGNSYLLQLQLARTR
jgi:hypothetical protein